MAEIQRVETSLFWKISDKILFPFLFPLLHVRSPKQDMGVGSAGTKDPKEEEECEGVGFGGVHGGLGGNRYRETDK